MSGRENNIGLIESASRRSFLGAGSAAIAAAAFGAFAANGQEREDKQMGQQVSGWAHILDGKVAVVTGAARGIGRAAERMSSASTFVPRSIHTPV